ncbi:hypothetical protein K7432_005355 [Basidiobolus ranarum]|uniref:DUF4211 domain-containing protein n=1 Tax=Basidiobolus ranarum TaxID=34480 RepID=A0ABR2W385_9FUNG
MYLHTKSEMKDILEDSQTNGERRASRNPKKRLLFPVVEISNSPNHEKAFFNPEMVPSSTASTPIEMYEDVQKTFTNVDSQTKNPTETFGEILQKKMKLYEPKNNISSEYLTKENSSSYQTKLIGNARSPKLTTSNVEDPFKMDDPAYHVPLKPYSYPQKSLVVHQISSGESDVEVRNSLAYLSASRSREVKNNYQSSRKSRKKRSVVKSREKKPLDNPMVKTARISLDEANNSDKDEIVHTPRKARKKNLILDQNSEDSDTEITQITTPKKRNLMRIDTSSEDDVQTIETPRRKRLLQKKKLENEQIEEEEISHLNKNAIISSRTRGMGTQVSKYRALIDKTKDASAVQEPYCDYENNLETSDIESFEETTSELEDFIADDESIEEIAQLPEEFSLSKCQDFNTAFQRFVHYLIYYAIDPTLVDGSSHDKEDLMKDSVVQVEKRLDMYSNSLVISQGWSQEFTDDLKMCPIYVSQPIPKVHTRCTGCMRMRTVSFQVNLLGPEYDRKTLKITDDDCEFGDPELDLCYSSFEPESIQFESDVSEYILGNMCHQRSLIFHQLYHFKFQTFRRIIHNIQGLGIDIEVTSTQEIIHRLEKINLIGVFLNEFENLIDNAERYCL